MLFCGTGCQVGALYAYLGKAYDNLTTLDIVCHGTPSPKMWDDFLNMREEELQGKITGVDFRDKKKFGWKAHRETITVDHTPYSSKLYSALFCSDNCFRPSCYECIYANKERCGDITLADFWGYEKALPEYPKDNKGVSLVLVNTQQGKKLWDEAKSMLDWTDCTGYPYRHGNMKHPTVKPETYDTFWKDYNENGFSYIMEKYADYSGSIKISIIIPVYNVEKYLPTCLESVLNQTMTEIEVILVNDGSTDASLNISKKYEKKHSRLFKVFTTENKGVSHARNYGIKKASGEFIMFVDSDDYIEHDMCEKLYQKAKKDQNDIVVCRFFDIFQNEDTNKITRKRTRAYEINIGRNFNLSDAKFELTHISPFPWDKLYRRKWFDQFSFPENMRFEDLAIIYPILCEAENIGVIEDRLYNYRRSSGQSFLSNFNEQTIDIVKAVGLIVEQVKKQGKFEIFYEEIEYICTRHLLLRYQIFFNKNTKGTLKLKWRLIKETQNFLDSIFPNWRQNRYLKYSSSSKINTNIKTYSKKSSLMFAALYWEYTPALFLELPERMKAFNKKKNKFPFLKIFRLPDKIKYTNYYEKYNVDSKKILFESKHGIDVAGNIFYMILSMSEPVYKDFTILLTLHSDVTEFYTKLLQNYGIDYVNIITFNSKEYLKALAESKYLITDTSFPAYFIKKEEQVYLNTWHGTPLKAMGRIVPKREYGLGNIQRNFLLADYLLYQNEFSRDKFIEDYMIEPVFNGKILLSGYPRNSAFFNEERYHTIRNNLELEKQQIIAYMPTWRGMLTEKRNKAQINALIGYFFELDQYLDDNQLLYVKLHPYIKQQLDYNDYSHILPFPEEYETYDFLNATDALITDYSSIMFDYAVSKKPIILFTYDREEYLQERGMYLDINQLEFPKADTVKELAEYLNTRTEYPEFYKKYCKYDNMNTAKNVCRQLIFNTTTDITIETIDCNKKNVLIFIDNITVNLFKDELLPQLNSADTSKYNYYLCMKTSAIKSKTSLLSKLNKDIFYIPMSFSTNYTIWDKIKSLEIFNMGGLVGVYENAMKKIADRERMKYFGDAKFDYVINLVPKSKIIFHMCSSFDGVKILNFCSYNNDQYQSEKKYRQLMKYFIKRFSYYDFIIGSSHIKEIAGNACIINEDPILEFEKILKEVMSWR